MHVQSCCFAYKTYCVSFDVLVAVESLDLKVPQDYQHRHRYHYCLIIIVIMIIVLVIITVIIIIIIIERLSYQAEHLPSPF